MLQQSQTTGLFGKGLGHFLEKNATLATHGYIKEMLAVIEYRKVHHSQ